MSELRDALPSTSEGMEGIPNFRNKPQCFDIFDIDGDGKAEVMGVQYYLAFRGVKHTPKASYAPNDRKGFYEWLYKDNIAYKDDGSAVIKEVPVCRFTGLKKAEEVAVLKDIPLYEAPYARESIQFYLTKPVNFDTKPGFELNRELRRVGAGYEPTFYTGFAPRSEDPKRLHLHVGRGNQPRITLVLSDHVSGKLRQRNLALMERLNPGRVFRIRIPVDELVRRWAGSIGPQDRKSMKKERQLELLNAMLPTRLWLTKLDPADSKALKALIERIPEGADADIASQTDPYLTLLEKISHGIYPRDGDHLEFAELTVIHPVGTHSSTSPTCSTSSTSTGTWNRKSWACATSWPTPCAIKSPTSCAPPPSAAPTTTGSTAASSSTTRTAGATSRI